MVEGPLNVNMTDTRQVDISRNRIAGNWNCGIRIVVIRTGRNANIDVLRTRKLRIPNSGEQHKDSH